MNLILLMMNLDSIKVYEHLPEVITTAKEYDFRNQLDMNTFIRIRRFRNIPALFDDTKYAIMSIGGVAPVFDALSVRGGGIADNLIMINGIPLHSPGYRVMHFLPIDMDNVEYIEFYRGNMPPSYEGFTSSVMKLKLTSREYTKVGLVNFSGNIRGFHWDLFYPSLFFSPNFKMNNFFTSYTTGIASALYIRDFLRVNRATFYGENDTLKLFLRDNQTWGASLEMGMLSLGLSHEKRYTKTITFLQGESEYSSDKTMVQLIVDADRWGTNIQFHRYVFHPDENWIYDSLNLGRTFTSISLYYRTGTFTSIGLSYFSQGKVLPLIRAGYKHFVDSTTAIRIFFGTSNQGFISMGYPLFEKYISKNRVSTGYALIIGLEKLTHNKALQIEGFLRYFRPYYSILALLFPVNPEVPTNKMFTSIPIVTIGMDLNMQDFRNSNMNVSLTLQRSLFTRNWKPTPFDIRYVFNFHYKYFSAMFVDGIMRWDVLLSSDSMSNSREHPMYIYSFMFPFRCKGFQFRVGIYNFIPQPRPDDELSAIYRAFPIPILSVKREF